MYDKNCDGCKISKGKKIPPGDIVKLDGGWVLNHYDGSDSFLGRLALQSERHCIHNPDRGIQKHSQDRIVSITFVAMPIWLR